MGTQVIVNYLALIILIVAASTDLLIPVILGFKYPGYDHFRDTISTLGTKESPVRKQESINLIIVGILFVIFAFGQGFAFENVGWSHGLYICGIIVFGIGCIIAGIFPEDPKGLKESVSGKIHGIASGIGFIFLILNPLWATSIDAFEKYQALNIFLFGAGIVTFTLFILSENKETGLLKYTGLFQRLNLIVLYGCLILNFTAITTTGY
jgi:hypothetical protein